MSYRITKIEISENIYDWGIVQINNLSDTYFRFHFVNGNPKLDTSFFADKEENPDEKHKNLFPESDLYKGIQNALNDLEYRIVGESPDGTKLNFEDCDQDQELKDAAFKTVGDAKKALKDFKMVLPDGTKLKVEGFVGT
ncbi:hypothetical protein FKN04_22720 [Bacillus glycinifermentans]|uniref:hypothetical protein n=1 Tax=Bacillus glycinifermentans TaxID=1664069 RepID=UPI0015823214|nr:hypothetical protein [Bacillus glycinifermentans]NUJ19349.1 hypothetical protein [Bacillus glycinifermentans]